MAFPALLEDRTGPSYDALVDPVRACCVHPAIDDMAIDPAQINPTECDTVFDVDPRQLYPYFVIAQSLSKVCEDERHRTHALGRLQLRDAPTQDAFAHSR